MSRHTESVKDVVANLDTVSHYLVYGNEPNEQDRLKTWDWIICVETWAYDNLPENSIHQLNILRRCKRLLSHPKMQDIRAYVISYS